MGIVDWLQLPFLTVVYFSVDDRTYFLRNLLRPKDFVSVGKQRAQAALLFEG